MIDWHNLCQLKKWTPQRISISVAHFIKLQQNGVSGVCITFSSLVSCQLAF